MLFEISWIPLSPVGREAAEEVAGQHHRLFDSIVLRAARLAKVGARVGRIHRGLQALWTVMGLHKGAAQDSDSMRGLSHQLMLSLSSKVSVLTIIFVLVLPMFNYFDPPMQDWSGGTWAMWLELDYTRACIEAPAAGGSSDMFKDTVGRLKQFYSDKPRRPFSVHNFPESPKVDGVALYIPGEFEDEWPNRLQNVLWERTERQSCCGNCTTDHPKVGFDLTRPHRREAALDVGMFFFMILIMVLSSYDIQRTVNRKVVLPLEQLFDKVRDVGRQLRLVDDGEATSRTSGEEVEKISETKLLLSIIDKLKALYLISNRDLEEENMDDNTRGVVNDMVPVAHGIRRTWKSTNSCTSGHAFHTEKNRRSRLHSQEPLFGELPVFHDLIDSWSLDVLELQLEKGGMMNLVNLVLWIFFDSRIGSETTRKITKLDTFNNFHGKVRGKYRDLPYHSYTHACDVLYTVYRELMLTHAFEWLSDSEMYALLVAALCHDMGHPGLNNAFLVESKDALAIRYNDKSPLENMHCAELFDLCNAGDSDIFRQLEKDKMREVRKICIATILHTDMEHHFEMVKEVAEEYIRASADCDLAATCKEGSEWREDYRHGVLEKKSMLWMQLFLHLADVSNPLKPFTICEKWAEKCLEEFFKQGDKERELHYPIGMLNDSGKVNKPGSQHVFINFVVAPLAKPAVQVFAPLHELTTQMVNNLSCWRNKWVETTRPSADEISKRDGEIQRWQKEASDLRLRVKPS
jgi:cAMP-specific phosphodiesterase 4